MSQTALVIGKNPGAIASVVGCLGVDVEFLTDSAEALREIARRKFGLIVYSSSSFCDKLLDFCVALRRIDHEIPLVVTAPRTAVEDRVWALDMGADDFLEPETYHIEQKARLSVLLRRAGIRRQANLSDSQGRSLSSYKIEDLEIDVDKKEARLKGKLLPLTPTEYSLLETLASHTGKTLSQCKLSDKVWGYDSDVYEGNIKWHMCRLRKKLSVSQSTPEYIVTVRSRGYRLLSAEERISQRRSEIRIAKTA